MRTAQPVPSIGVEEEYQLVDATTGVLRPDCKRVMQHLRHDPKAEIQHELFLNQIEMASPVCQTLDDVRRTVAEVRGALADSAEATDTAIISAGINPQPVPDEIVVTPKRRYLTMTERYQQIARQLLIFGCHVHVEMQDRELGVEVMNRSRRWLPVLLALTTNAPFWNGEDTGYASFRRELWIQWPMAGPPEAFKDFADYQKCVADLVSAGAVKDETHIYWDIRLPHKIPTIEFRGGDAMTRIDETVGYVGLIRGLVMRCIEDVHSAKPVAPIRESVLSYAMWHAARYGMTETLVDPADCEQSPAGELARELLDYVRPAAEQAGDGEAVTRFIEDVLQNGTGADRQRKWAGREEDYPSLMQQLIRETRAGVKLGAVQAGDHSEDQQTA